MTSAIGDYAIIGDCRSAALVSRRGSIDWLCWPRFDSPSLFAAILDDERGGCFSISPVGPFHPERRYVPGTNVLQTHFITLSGEVCLTDFMPVRAPSARGPYPEHAILRLVRGIRGEVELDVVFDPRPDYARRAAKLHVIGKLGVRMPIPGSGVLTLSSEPPLDASGRARIRVRAGEQKHFVLTLATELPAVLPPPGDGCLRAFDETVSLWRTWSDRTVYDGLGREMVARSALVLKLLQYAPSGAIVAAPTTSLPERPGGDLNWDYRFCWLRDAALTARALYGLGHHEEADAFISWLLNATSLSLPKLHVLYDVFGRQPGPEVTLPHLRGHGGARPVRIGNAAKGQVQLDTYGEVIEAAAYLARMGGTIDDAVGRMLVGFGREVAKDFDEPDEGIWEVRGLPRRYTHSRVLCWTGLQRLLELHEKGHLRGVPAAEFIRARDAIRQEIETLGWSDLLQSYTRTLSGGDVDASLLLMAWYGYCPADAPRMQATWRRIQEHLGVGGGLYRRYHGELTRGEGAFGICSFWAAEYLALGGGTLGEAEDEFQRLLKYANDVGLYAEEIDPGTGAARGNFPQAFTHVGLINAALSLHQRAARGKKEAFRAHLRVPEAQM